MNGFDQGVSVIICIEGYPSLTAKRYWHNTKHGGVERQGPELLLLLHLVE